MSMKPWPVPSDWDVVISDYLDDAASAGQRLETLRTRRSHLCRFARDKPDGIGSVTPRMVSNWLAKQVWAPETRRSYTSTLRGFFLWAEREGYVVGVVAVLPSVRIPKSVPRPCPRAVIREAIAASDSRVELMIRLGADQGLRCGEISRLVGTDAYLCEHGWELRVMGKGGKERSLPMMEDLGVLVSSFHDSHVFSGNIGGHLSSQTVGSLIEQALPGRWTAHTLRHRFATDLWHATHDIVLVQQMLGHASPATTMKYILVEGEDLRAGMDLFESHVRG